MKRILPLFLFALCHHVEAEMSLFQVMAEIEKNHKLRESLVSGVQGPVDSKTFKAVCKPVGMKFKQLGKTSGWQIKQTSAKYRNPKHAPNDLEKKALAEFQKDKNLTSFVWKQEGGSQHYFRRISVQASCLNCHGEKNKRPKFIKAKYKADRAFGFKVGELRGLYHASKSKTANP